MLFPPFLRLSALCSEPHLPHLQNGNETYLAGYPGPLCFAAKQLFLLLPDESTPNFLWETTSLLLFSVQWLEINPMLSPEEVIIKVFGHLQPQMQGLNDIMHTNVIQQASFGHLVSGQSEMKRQIEPLPLQNFSAKHTVAVHPM